MQKIRLTDIACQKLPPGMHWCAATPAFGLRVGKRARTFVCVRDGGKRITIGRYPSVSLSDARRKAKGILVSVYDRTAPIGYADALELYLKQMERELRPNTVYIYRILLKRFQFKTLSISPGEIKAALDTVEKASARLHCYAALKIFFNWCMRQEYVESNPVSRVQRPRGASARERTLEDHELAKIWRACDELGKYGALVRLLMATGQRKGQFAGLKEEWVDWKGKRFIWPASAMKSNKVHVLPFNHLAEFVLRGVMPNGGYYFSPATALGQPFTAWSKNKIALDRSIDIDPWTPHDLRRTFSTNAARLDIAPHITERILSHVAPEGKVSAIYNRFKYEKEMREAMEKMSTFLMTLISE